MGHNKVRTKKINSRCSEVWISVPSVFFHNALSNLNLSFSSLSVGPKYQNPIAIVLNINIFAVTANTDQFHQVSTFFYIYNTCLRFLHPHRIASLHYLPQRFSLLKKKEIYLCACFSTSHLHVRYVCYYFYSS